MSYAIKIHGRIGRDIRTLAQRELTEVIASFRALDATNVATLPHDIRKRLKRLRALVSLLREPMGKKVCSAEDATLRDAARGLAAVRDAQAQLKTLQHLQQRFFPGRTPARLHPLREALRHQEQDRSAALLDSATRQQTIAALEAALARVAHWPIAEYGWKELRRAVKRSYRRAREGYLQARETPSAAPLHRWRKQVKELGVHLRLIQRVCPPLMDELTQDFKVLGEFLGNDHDLVVLRADFQTGRDTPALATFLDLLDLRREELRNAAFDLGERLLADAPGSFARELDALRSAQRQRLRDAKKLAARLGAH